MKDGIEVMERDADDIVSEEGKGEIQLTSEDYLQGVIGMVNELVSFSCTPHTSQERRRGLAFLRDMANPSPDYRLIRLLLRTLSYLPESQRLSTTSSLPTP
jgi:hypothetical protein